MKNNVAGLWAALWLLGTVCIVAQAGAKTLTVGPAQTGCPHGKSAYTSISAAVAAASSGDVIEICPAVYPEQLIITRPLTLRGVEFNGFSRALLRPTLSDLQGLATEAVITVIGTHDVTIDNLAVDASQNTVASCSPGVAGIHFYNASGTVTNSAVLGAELPNPLSCTSLPFGNGFDILVDDSQSGPFAVSVLNNSIHDYTANGVQANGSGINVEIANNTISGVGPATGIFQFAVFLANGTVGHIHDNTITEGLCGSVDPTDCINIRSEGVTLRAIGDGTVVEHNFISNAQSGIFINGANNLKVIGNVISNIDAMSGMDIQGTASGFFTNSHISRNSISNVGPINSYASNNEEGCGINEYSGTGVSGNEITDNTINDAYCGVAYVSADFVQGDAYFNTLYTELNADLYPTTFPPATEP
jgi:hypothetical protein